MAEGKSSAGIWSIIAVIVIVLIAGIWFVQTQKLEPGGVIDTVERVTIADGTSFLSAPVYVAFEKGYFKDEGLDVLIQPHTSGKDTLNVLIAGKADLATTSETPVMHIGLKGEKTYVISTIVTAEKHNAIVARKDRDISTPSDLKDKTIGVTIGSNGEFFLDTFLLINGIKRDEIKAVHRKPQERFDALVSGEVDAVSGWNPYMKKLQKELGDNGITFYGGGLYTATFNIVARQDYVKENPGIIKKVLRALISATEFIKENPEETHKIVSGYFPIDEALLKELEGIYDFEVRLDQSFILTLEDQARWAIRNNLTDKTAVPNYLNYIYLHALEDVKPDAVTIIH